MGHLAELRGDAARPIRAVIDGIRGLDALGADAGIRVERQVIGRPHDAGGFAGRPRTILELHRGLARAARPRQIGREVLAVELDDLADLGVGAGIDAGAGNHLHQVDDLVPAGLVELELQRIARGVAAGALVGEDLLDVGVFRRGVRQCRDHHFRRQLTIARLGVGDGGELEVLVLGRRQIDGTGRGLEAERLRPYAIFAVGQRREEIVAVLVGIDARRDGRAFLLGRHLHAFELLAGRRCDRAGQQLIGASRGGQSERDQTGDAR